MMQSKKSFKVEQKALKKTDHLYTRRKDYIFSSYNVWFFPVTMYVALKKTIMIFSIFINFLANFEVSEKYLRNIFGFFYQKVNRFFSNFAKYLKNRTRRNTKLYVYVSKTRIHAG